MLQKRKFEQTNLKAVIRENSRIIVDQTIREEEIRAQKLEDEAKVLLDKIVENLSYEHARRMTHKIHSQSKSESIIGKTPPQEVSFQVFGHQPEKISQRVVQLLEEQKIRAKHSWEHVHSPIYYIKVDMSSIDED